MTARVLPTLSPSSAAGRVWDAIVVGAGPAGSAAAVRLAQRHASVLLLERTSLPRWKVCGCCLNAAAMDALRILGIPLPAAISLHTLDLFSNGRRVTLPLRRSAAISRESLDASLARAAIRAGAHYLDGATALESDARVADQRGEPVACGAASPDRLLRVRTRDHGTLSLRARTVLSADGLSAPFANSLAPSRVSALGPRIGLGLTLATRTSLARGRVSMSVARFGYVGAVVLEDGRLNVAAAIAPGFLRRAGGPACAVGAILEGAGAGMVALPGDAPWRGTPILSRRRSCLELPRVLVLGDAAAYVEPFTGEGIAWALRSGILAADATLDALSRSAPADWARRWRRHILPHHHRCALVALALRSPMLTSAALRLSSAIPRASSAVVARFGAAPAGAHA